MSGVDRASLYPGALIEITLKPLVVQSMTLRRDGEAVYLGDDAAGGYRVCVPLDQIEQMTLLPPPTPPLPTTAGAVIRAMVTHGRKSAEGVTLIRDDTDLFEESWFSGVPVAGCRWHHDEHLSDVTVIYDPSQATEAAQ